MKGLSYWLPKGSILLDGTWDKDSKNCGIKVGTLIEADTSSSRWLLTRNINNFFEDTLVLEVDPATGLLKTVNGTSEDKTAQIVATALEAAAKAMTFGAGAPVLAAAAAETPPPCGCTEIELPGTFHFKIPIDELPSRRGQLYCKCLKITGPVPPPAAGKPDDKPEAPVVELKVEVRRMDAPTTHEGTQIGKIEDGNTIVDGIVVRAPAPYEIRVSQHKPESTLYGEQTVFLPDPARIYYLPLDRTPFVKNETKIGLVNGVVQNVTVTRPSIILGIVGVPKTILTALVPLK